MHRAVFLDRDGVINSKAPEGRYITRWADFQFLPGVAAAIARLHQSGFLVIIVTNQRGIARGLMTIEDLEEIHRRMEAALASSNAHIHAIYYCPHDVSPACACRKPAAGMLLQAAKDHGIDLHNSWMVGDSDRDILAGQNAGCRTIRILPSGTPVHVPSDRTVQSLDDAATEIIQADVAQH